MYNLKSALKDLDNGEKVQSRIHFYDRNEIYISGSREVCIKPRASNCFTTSPIPYK